MVASETSMVQETATTDQGPQPNLKTGDVTSFVVVHDKEENNIRLFHDGIKIIEYQHDNRLVVSKAFETLLSTVKQKLRFWRTN